MYFFGAGCPFVFVSPFPLVFALECALLILPLLLSLELVLAFRGVCDLATEGYLATLPGGTSPVDPTFEVDVDEVLVLSSERELRDLLGVHGTIEFRLVNLPLAVGLVDVLEDKFEDDILCLAFRRESCCFCPCCSCFCCCCCRC